MQIKSSFVFLAISIVLSSVQALPVVSYHSHYLILLELEAYFRPRIMEVNSTSAMSMKWMAVVSNTIQFGNVELKW
jgi:hypothetical protein